MIKGLYDRGYLVYFYEGDEAIYRDKLNYSTSVEDIYHVINYGETLYDISRERYGTSYYWYLLADVNDNIEDIFDLPIGEIIIIPSLLRF